MRTFHTGGAAGAADITQGLPRVQELFEARTPRGEAAVAEALRSGALGGLGVDVLAKEPPTADNPLLHTPNTLITPHMAWATARSRQNIINLTAENILRWQQGTPVNVVNGVKD